MTLLKYKTLGLLNVVIWQDKPSKNKITRQFKHGILKICKSLYKYLKPSTVKKKYKIRPLIL